MWCGVGKTNHNDEPYIKPVKFDFLQTGYSRTVRLFATASGDVNYMVGGARTGKTFPGAMSYTINCMPFHIYTFN